MKPILATAFVLLLAADADACSRCGRYYSACRYYKAPAPVQQVTYPNNSINVSYHYQITQIPAQQGSTQYTLRDQFQSYQQVDLAIPASVALADRYASAGAQVMGIAGQAQQAAAAIQSQALGNHSQALRIAETQVLANAGAQYLSALRAGLTANGVSVLNQQVHSGWPQTGGGLQAQQLSTSALNQFCASCHGTGLPQPKGNLYLGTDQQTAGEMKARYFAISERVNAKTMPPPEAPQPTDDQRRALMDEIRAAIKAVPQVQPLQNQQGPAPMPPAPASPMGGR